MAENRRLTALLVQAGLDPHGAPAAPATAAHAPSATLSPRERDYFQLLLDSMSEGFYVVDSHGLTTVCNIAMVRLLGFSHEREVLGRSLHEIVHHSRADGSPYPVDCCPIYRAAREGRRDRVSGEVFFRCDGTAFPIEYRTEPVIREGQVLGAICTFVDVTQRAEAERQLKTSEDRLALALAAGGIGTWDHVPQTGALRWDDRVRALFGLGAGKPITIEANMAAVHPADRARVEAALAGAFDPAGSGDCEVQFRAIGIDDGQERWIESKGRATFVDGVAQTFTGVSRDVSQAKQSERHLRLLINELNHRVKNSLAMVQGVAAQTLRGPIDIDTARANFSERLVALARAHDVLTATRWEGADLGEVVALGVQPHETAAGERFDVEGPVVALSPKAALAFSMALHELAINAVKYGALSVEGGRVAITWAVAVEDTAARLRFRWQERGGPAVVTPKRRGFGSKLIERGLAAELQGTVQISFDSEGVACSIDAPYLVPVQRTAFP